MKEKLTKSHIHWIPVKERRWVFIFLGLTVILLLFGLWNMLDASSMNMDERQFKEYFKSYGSNARILLFAVLGFYACKLTLQKKWVERWNIAKKLVTLLLKITRKIHVPFAIIAIGLIALHIVGAFLYGFKFDFTNLSGLIAGLVLIGVPIAGVLRFRRLDRKWHLRLGLVFTVLFLIHSYL